MKHRGTSTPIDNVDEVKSGISGKDLQKNWAVEFHPKESETKEPSDLELKTMVPKYMSSDNIRLNFEG